ncbi:MAG: hypothetical protein CMJ83_20645 [Planctomycetes bacterium]|nr:hypothetical protein [Planctomycetota bacterium]
MAFTFQDRTISKIGVIGSGQIGPDIALYFAKVLSPEGVSIVVVDISEEALAKGQARLDKKVDRGVKGGAFKPEAGQAMKDAVTWTSDYGQVAGATLVVEAATEEQSIKQKIFTSLEEVCGPDAILASNSSHLEPEVIASSLNDRRRSLVVHYFFPAERNYMVEVVPGEETDPDIVQWVMAFYERIGKVPVRVGSRYGYAVDPIFEGLFLAAALAAEKGMGTTKEIDAVATRALGLTVGPFTAMNLTGGNPITMKGLPLEGEKIMSWFRAPQSLVDKVEAGEAWDVPGRGETVEIDADRERAITEELQGAYLGLSDEVLSSGIIDMGDFEMAIEMSLDMIPPARLANQLGVARAHELARAYADANDGFQSPRWLAAADSAGRDIDIPVVVREDTGGVAVVRVRRPKSLNSLNDAAFEQLYTTFSAIRDDDAITAAVLSGFGTKAFVSGADVKFLAEIDGPETGMKNSKTAQDLTRFVEQLGKPVVCAFNGLAFGGGLEIAMACRARIAVEGLKPLGGQPEVNLGIIPGAGGAVRLQRWVGIEKAAELLRTGRPVSAAEALEIGLITETVDRNDLLARAVALAREIASGSADVPSLSEEPLSDVPDSLPAVDIGHRSQAIDAILCRVIVESCRVDLDAGLALENAAWGEVCNTQDMRIGIDTFLNEGARAKAAFVHA